MEYEKISTKLSTKLKVIKKPNILRGLKPLTALLSGEEIIKQRIKLTKEIYKILPKQSSIMQNKVFKHHQVVELQLQT